MAKSIKQQVRELEQRVDRAMPLSKFIARTQINQLMRAEKLRKLALAVVASQHRRPFKNGFGGTSAVFAVSESKIKALGSFLKDLNSFHSHKGRIPKAVREMLK